MSAAETAGLEIEHRGGRYALDGPMLNDLVSYQVSRRTREIGIRMALGAERLHVMNIFLKQAAVMSAIGILAGVVLSGFISRIAEDTLGQTPSIPCSAPSPH